MKNNFKNAGWALLMALTLYSCKKDTKQQQLLTDSQQIENAKSWYENEQKGQLKTINASNGKEVKLFFMPDWLNASVEQIEGQTVIIAEVKTNLRKLFGRDSEFSLVLKKENGGFSYRTVSTKGSDELSPVDLYRTAFENSDLSRGRNLNAELKVFDSHFKSNGTILYSSNGKTVIGGDSPSTKWTPFEAVNVNGNKIFKASDIPRTAAETTGCIDYYLVTRVYLDGQLVDVQEIFLHRNCQAGDNPSDPDNENTTRENQYDDISLNFGSAVSIDEGGTVMFENDTARSKKVVWTFCDGTVFKFKSREIKTQVKFNGGPWQFAALIHSDHYAVEDMISGTVGIDGFNWSQINYLNEVTAFVEWRTKITLNILGYESNHLGDYDESFHTWTSW